MAKIRFAKHAVSVGVVGLVGALVVAGAGSGAASAATGSPASGDVKTAVDKIVNQTADSSGTITGNTMVTQVSATGNGTMNVQVPMGSSSLRDLNSFGGVPMDGDSAVFNQTVNGSTTQRIMSKSDLAPIKVEVNATLDGKSIEPGDVIDKTGVLDVQYKITNTTQSTSPVTYRDGSGNTVTQNLPTAAPFFGSLEVTLPKGFNEISAPGTTGIGGDGHNGTLLDYTMTLFPPLGNKVPLSGASEVTIGYQSRITNATLPAAQFVFTPVVPYTNSTIAETKSAITTETADGAKLVAAGTKMGASLDKLTAPTGVPHLINEMSSGITTATKDLNKLTGPTVGTDAIVSAKAIAAGSSKVQRELSAAMPELNELGDIEATLVGLMKKYQPEIVPLLTALGNKTVALPDMGNVPISQIAMLIPAIVGQPTVPSPTCSTLGALSLYWAGCIDTKTADIATQLATIKTACPTCASDVTAITKQNQAMATTSAPLMALVNYPGGASAWESWPTLVSFLAGQINTLIGEVWKLPVVQSLFENAPALRNSVAAFLDSSDTLVEQSNATVDALYPAVDSMMGLRDGLSQSLDNSQAIAGDADSLVAAGPEALTAIGVQVTDQHAPTIAQLNVMQQMGEAGDGIPYGPATGPGVTTTATYNLAVAGAGATKKDDTINWVLGILLLLVAAGVGTALWTRRRAA